jgi:MYXO-CTERM domain-containing protein
MHFLSDKNIVAADLSLTDGVYIDVSEDAGKTWRQTVIQTDVYDRPWIAGRGQDVYVTMKGFDAVPYLFVSHDLGRTFSRTPVLTYGGGTAPAELSGVVPNNGPTAVDALVTNQNAYVDSLTVDPKSGIVYVLYGIDGVGTYPSHPPLGAPNRLYVARLEPETNPVVLPSAPVYLGGADDAFYGGFNWMTVDGEGTVYVVGNGLHAGHQSIWLSYSTDHGKTWSALKDVGTPGVSSIYAAIDPVKPGTLVTAYYEGTKADSNTPQDWFATMSVVDGANTSSPTVTHRQHVVAKPVHTKDICLDGLVCGLPGFGDNRNLLDYVDNEVGPDGSMWGVFSSDGPATGETTGDPTVVLVRLKPLGTPASSAPQTVTTVPQRGKPVVTKAPQPSAVSGPGQSLASTGLGSTPIALGLLALGGAVLLRRRVSPSRRG